MRGFKACLDESTVLSVAWSAAGQEESSASFSVLEGLLGLKKSEGISEAVALGLLQGVSEPEGSIERCKWLDSGWRHPLRLSGIL